MSKEIQNKNENENENENDKKKVINVKVSELRKNGFSSLEDWLSASSFHIYIGRNMSFYVKGAEKSVWHNPFPIKKYGLVKSLELYEKHVRQSPQLWNNLESLKDKTLGCWCAPNPCHGDILLALIEEKLSNSTKNQNDFT